MLEPGGRRRDRACRAWGRDVWKAERDKEKANKLAQPGRRAAALTAALAAQSEWKTAVVCDQPPGLGGHIEAPDMEAGGSRTPNHNDAGPVGHKQSSLRKREPGHDQRSS